MAVKNPTQWQAPGGIGYVNIANNNVYLNPVGSESPLASITTQSGVDILTQSGVNLTVNPNVFSFKNPTSWASWRNERIQGDSQSYNAGQNPSQWIPKGGYGYVYTSLNYSAWGDQGMGLVPGTYEFTDNLGNFLVTNSGNNLVTNDIVVIGKNPTLWADSGV